MTGYVPTPQTLGKADHAAPATGLLASLPFRTFLQGLALDLLLAICLVVLEATNSGSIDWGLLGFSLVRTALQTAASSVMKRLKPPAGLTQ